MEPNKRKAEEPEEATKKIKPINEPTIYKEAKNYFKHKGIIIGLYLETDKNIVKVDSVKVDKFTLEMGKLYWYSNPGFVHYIKSVNLWSSDLNEIMLDVESVPYICPCAYINENIHSTKWNETVEYLRKQRKFQEYELVHNKEISKNRNTCKVSVQELLPPITLSQLDIEKYKVSTDSFKLKKGEYAREIGVGKCYLYREAKFRGKLFNVVMIYTKANNDSEHYIEIIRYLTSEEIKDLLKGKSISDNTIPAIEQIFEDLKFEGMIDEMGDCMLFDKSWAVCLINTKNYTINESDIQGKLVQCNLGCAIKENDVTWWNVIGQYDCEKHAFTLTKTEKRHQSKKPIIHESSTKQRSKSKTPCKPPKYKMEAVIAQNKPKRKKSEKKPENKTLHKKNMKKNDTHVNPVDKFKLALACSELNGGWLQNQFNKEINIIGNILKQKKGVYLMTVSNIYDYDNFKSCLSMQFTDMIEIPFIEAYDMEYEEIGQKCSDAVVHVRRFGENRLYYMFIECPKEIESKYTKSCINNAVEKSGSAKINITFIILFESARCTVTGEQIAMDNVPEDDLKNMLVSCKSLNEILEKSAIQYVVAKSRRSIDRVCTLCKEAINYFIEKAEAIKNESVITDDVVKYVYMQRIAPILHYVEELNNHEKAIILATAKVAKQNNGKALYHSIYVEYLAIIKEGQLSKSEIMSIVKKYGRKGIVSAREDSVEFLLSYGDLYEICWSKKVLLEEIKMISP